MKRSEVNQVECDIAGNQIINHISLELLFLPCVYKIYITGYTEYARGLLKKKVECQLILIETASAFRLGDWRSKLLGQQVAHTHLLYR